MPPALALGRPFQEFRSSQFPFLVSYTHSRRSSAAKVGEFFPKLGARACFGGAAVPTQTSSAELLPLSPQQFRSVSHTPKPRDKRRIVHRSFVAVTPRAKRLASFQRIEVRRFVLVIQCPNLFIRAKLDVAYCTGPVVGICSSRCASSPGKGWRFSSPLRLITQQSPPYTA